MVDIDTFAIPPEDDDPSEPKRLLIAMIETQHRQLNANIEENRKMLLDYIGGLAWPCQESPCGAVSGNVQAKTFNETQAGAQPKSPKSLAERVLNDATFASDAGFSGGGSSVDHPVLRQCSGEGKTDGTAANTGNAGSSGLVGDGMFRGPVRQSQARFDMAICGVIVLNALVIILQSQWESYRASVSLGLSEEGGWKNAEFWFEASEHLFAIVFLLEFLVRVRILGRRYFTDPVNIFDACLVLNSLIELYILTPLGESSGANLSGLRLVRLCKAMRLLRVVRIMRLFSSLHVLVSAIVNSLSSLFWSMIVLFMIILLGGLFMSQVLADYITDTENPWPMRNWVFKYYGGSARATLTLFEITMSGCWPNYSRRLIEEVSIWYVLFFVFYIAAVVFAVTRVISAIFLRDTLQAANCEADRMVNDARRQRTALMHQLENFFKEADKSGDGLLDRNEFEEIFRNPKVRLWFRAMDLQIHEYVGLFDLLENEAGVVSFQDFLNGVMRLKGQARSIDMLSVALEVSKISNTLAEILKVWQQASQSAPLALTAPLNPVSVESKARSRLRANSGSSRWVEEG